MLGEIEAWPAGCSNLEEALRMKDYYFQICGYQWYADEVKRFHQSQAPIRIVTAPARTSKSYSTFPEIIAGAMPTNPPTSSLTWSIGPTYDTNKEFQYVWKYLVDERARWTKEWGRGLNIERALNNPTNGSMMIVLDWGVDKKTGERCRGIIEGKSSTNDKALQGEHVSLAVFSEAAEHPEQVWAKQVSTRASRAIFPTTPKPYAEWLHAMIEQGEKDPSLGIDTFQYPKEANPFYDHDRYEREKKMAASRSPTGKAADDPWFAEQFMGLWVYYTGMVLPLNPAKHVVKLESHWLDHCNLFISTDYGYEDACVAMFWAQMPSGALLIWDEVYERHLTTPEFVDAITDKLGDRKKQLDYVCGDPKQPQVAQYLMRYGLNVIDVNKRAQADRAVGHRRLVDLLSDDPVRGNPNLYIADCCQKTISEWKHLRYREGFTNEYGTTSMKGADHAFDAARYFVTTMPEPAREPQAEDWQRYVKRQLANDERVMHHDVMGSGFYTESY